jgi:hypothetical protein
VRVLLVSVSSDAFSEGFTSGSPNGSGSVGTALAAEPASEGFAGSSETGAGVFAFVS